MKRFTKCLWVGMTTSVILACAGWSVAELAVVPAVVPQEVPSTNVTVMLAEVVTNIVLTTLPATGGVVSAEAVTNIVLTTLPVTGGVVLAEAATTNGVTAASPATVVVVPVEAVMPRAVDTAGRETNTETLYIERGETPAGVNLTTSGTNANLISIQLDKTPLEEVVKLFVRVSGANIIVVGTNLTGQVVTANLNDVEWKPALISILNQFNLDLLEKSLGSSIYSIGPKQMGVAEPLLSEHFPLSFVSVSNVLPVVTSILGTGGGSVVGFPSGNSLVVRATDRQLQDIRKVIKSIDTQRKQVYIETKFVELSDEAIKDLGINWQSLQAYKVTAGNLTRTLNDSRSRAKANVSSDTKTDARNNVDTVNQDFNESGAQFPGTPGGTPPPARTVIDTINRGRTVQSTVSDTINNTFTDVRTAVLSASDFAVVLSALQQQNGISIVSNPKLIVANEASANIHIGINQPNVRGTVTAGQLGQGNTVTYALDGVTPYFMFGITLDVIPTINTDTNITVRIKPKLSRKLDDFTAPDGTHYPTTSETTLDTVFALGAERTAVIGGLTETDARDSVVKIPFLGDIPLLGKYLFSYQHKSKKQTETIIFVTVGIADPAVMLPSIGLPREAELIMDHLKSRGISTNRAPLLDDNPPPPPPPLAKK